MDKEEDLEIYVMSLCKEYDINLMNLLEMSEKELE